MMKSLIDLRAVGLALVLAVAAALPFMTTNVERRDFYFFDVTLTSTSPGATQFFWDLGKGYNEQDSSRQPLKIEPSPVVYRYMMPMGEFKGLRLDPLDGVGTMTLAHAQIVDVRGHVVHRFGPADFKPFAQIAHTEIHGDTLTFHTVPGATDAILELEFPRPLRVASNWRIWLELGRPVAVPVFIAGLILGCPFVARRLQRGALALAARLRDSPRMTIVLAATLAVAVQCQPVLFQGRSFVSPNNGGHMLYDGLPALPGQTDPMSANTGSSDTGALLFQHLYFPMLQRDALAAGELPLWNRHSLGGEPLLGQGQSMFGDPFNFLTIATDGASWSWDLRFLIARWILSAGLGGVVWCLTRHLGASVLTTVSAAFLGFFTFRLTHPANFSVGYSPLILLAWCALHTATTPRRLAVGLGALVAANWTVMMSGTVKEAYMLMVGLNFAGALLLWRRPDTAGRRGRVFAAACVGGAAFVLLTAPGWVSFLSAWHHSMTGYDTPQADMLRWSHVIGLFDDIFYRQTTADERVVAPALNFFFLLGVLWWLVQPRAWRTPFLGGAILLAALPSFALAFGLVPKAVVLRIPFVANIVHVGNTFSCVLLILGAVLGGLGFRDAWDRLRDPAARGTIARIWLAALVLAGLYFLTTREFPKSPFFGGYTAALAAAFFLLPLGVRWGLLRPDRPGPLWVVVILGLPLLGWRHAQFRTSAFDKYVFVPGPRADFHARSPAVELIDAHKPAAGRVVGWDSVLYASYNIVPRWEGMYGVNAVRSVHFHDLADSLGLQRVWNWDWPNREADARDLVRKYDSYNVTNYLATHRDGPHPIEGLVLLGQADLDVYASPTAWPRAFYVDRLAAYDRPADFAKLITGGDGKPFAAVQRGTPVPPALSSAGDRVTVPARDYRLEPNRTTFTVEAPGPGVAVLIETYYLDDFEVTLNGRPADYFRVNHAFRGVALPAAGTYEVSFRYWPEHFTTALRAGLAGLLILLAGGAWLWSRRVPVHG
ncbi:MAG TPA: hypothetical protein VG734_10625 [Lacunisphaera sp.]|nr:hypothetical protein [Lacunisphaera sp.]